MSSVPEQFAFGRNETDGCACPAVAAGMEPDSHGEMPGLLEAAETYDRVVRENQIDTSHYGIIEQDFAKGMWLQAIERLEPVRGEDNERSKAAKRVARELGWLDE